MELVSSVDQAVIEAIATVKAFDFVFHNLSIHFRRLFLQRCCEDDAFTLLDWHFKIAWHQEVFSRLIATFTFFWIIQTTIPIGLIVEFVFCCSLHVEFGITFIHTHLDTIFHRFVSSVCHTIFMSPLSHAAESQEGFQAKCGRRMRFEQSVANKKAESISTINQFLLQQHATNAINPSRHFIPLETHDVLVSLWTVVFSLVFVQSQVKFSAMLNHGLVQRGE